MFSRAAPPMGDRTVTIQLQMQVKGLNGARELLRAIPKRIALPVFASDALSSVAYAPDEILLTLAFAGLARECCHE